MILSLGVWKNIIRSFLLLFHFFLFSWVVYALLCRLLLFMIACSNTFLVNIFTDRKIWSRVAIAAKLAWSIWFTWQNSFSFSLPTKTLLYFVLFFFLPTIERLISYKYQSVSHSNMNCIYISDHTQYNDAQWKRRNETCFVPHGISHFNLVFD